MAASPRQLEAFRAVIVAGTVTGAAELLRISQPAVSRLLADLEQRLGCRLFERRQRRLIATPEGEHLLSDVENALAAIDKVSLTAGALTGLRAGHLDVAALPGLSHRLLPEILREFLAERPEIGVSLQIRNAPKVIDLVVNAQVDVAIAAPPFEQLAIDVDPLPATPLLCVFPRGHRLARRRVVHARDLQGEPFVSITKEAFIRYRIDDVFEREGVKRRLAIETPMGATACALVAEGLGVSIVDRFSAMHYARQRLIAKPFYPLVPYELALAFPKNRPRSLLAEAFGLMVRARLAAEARLGPPLR